jgi:SagB-type dehydrogenase family enzyme
MRRHRRRRPAPSPPAAGFVREPIELADLAFVLETACGNDRLHRTEGVELYVAAHRIAGLAPGLYRYAAGAHRLVELRSGDLSGSMVNACLRQEMAGSAAAGLVMVGSVARAAARAGERSYRDLLLEAGAIGQRAYLAAEALGLAARNLAAFLDDWFNDLLGLDGAERAALHLTMIGRESPREG